LIETQAAVKIRTNKTKIRRKKVEDEKINKWDKESKKKQKFKNGTINERKYVVENKV
jgi:hypothetical protein